MNAHETTEHLVTTTNAMIASCTMFSVTVSWRLFLSEASVKDPFGWHVILFFLVPLLLLFCVVASCMAGAVVLSGRATRKCIAVISLVLVWATVARWAVYLS